MRLTNDSNRNASKILQNVAGLYGLVVPCEDVQFPSVVVGHLTGGEPLRAILPKVLGEQDKELSSAGGEGGTFMGYGLQLTYDVPVGQYNGVLCVKVVRDNLLTMLLITIIGNHNGEMTDYWPMAEQIIMIWLNNQNQLDRYYLSW
jgi:hypothetical protein